MSHFSDFICSLSQSVSTDQEHNDVVVTTDAGPNDTEHTISDDKLTFDMIKTELETRYSLKVKWYKDLFIITYPKRDTKVSSKVDYKDPLVKECRGLIVNRKSPFNIVCKGFNMLESTESIPDDILTRSDGKITTTIDGSYIKLYYNNDLKRWCVSTNRCIEAKKARWHSYRTFFDYFQDASRSPDSLLDYSKLNTEHVYLFVVCHPENRIVKPYTSSMLYHIGTLDRTDGWKQVEGDDIGIPHPPEVDQEYFESLQATRDHVNGLEWQSPGYVAQWVGEDGSIRRSKIRNETYEHINDLRGDNRSSVEHYLNLRSDTDHPERFMEFTKYFPEYSVVEDHLNMAARYVHQLYLSYYVHHTVQYVDDRICWRLLAELHMRFIRTKESTTLDIVQQYIRSMPNDELAKLLRF